MIKEIEIRPRDLLRKYLNLSETDAARFFSAKNRETIACVACGNLHNKYAFCKAGFTYSICTSCGTLYLNPRPLLSEFDAFYQDSESSKYWAETFFPAVVEIRREKIIRDKVEKLALICESKNLNVGRLVDVGAGFGIFLDEWRKKFPTSDLLAIEPSSSLSAACREKGLNVVESILERVNDSYNGHADLVVCFEVIEHVHSPLEFLNHLKRLCRQGGYILISTLCIDGFDLQTLWHKSTQISPPHHINFLSKKGFFNLFTNAGLGDISVSTPGKLDVDIVRNAASSDPEILRNQPFIERLINDESVSKAFQKFLANNCLSSHAWILARVP